MSAASTSASWLFPWDDLADGCKDDARIRAYVAHRSTRGENAARMVAWPDVLTEFSEDRAFADAVSLESYATFAGLAYAVTLTATDIRDLTGRFNWRALRRFLTTRASIGIIFVLLALALVQRDYVAFAGQLLAFLAAPSVGLVWHAWRRKHSISMVMLAVALSLSGIVALAVPVAFRFSIPYSSWLLAGYVLGVVWVLAQDHDRRPLFRGLKEILLLPAAYGLERRAIQAREVWLADAREKAVMPELVQAINRLLPPERRKRLLVEEAPGLAATYHPSLQVPTRAARRAENALRSSDGASLAVSGPRGCGKTALLKELCQDQSRFAVLVSAPTRYAPNEFLIDLFQRLCIEYIKSRGFPVESAGPRTAGALLVRVMRSAPVLILRLLATITLVGLLAWDLAVRSATQDLDRLARLPGHLWADKYLLTLTILVGGICLLLPKRDWRMRRRRGEDRLVAEARRYLLQLQAEQTATTQIGGGLPVMQAAFSRAVALRSLPWSMPELVGHLCDFVAHVTNEQSTGRTVLICIDEVDRIGSAEEASQFLSEIKAIFGVPQCYFVVAIAEEFGAAFGRRAITGRTIADNVFDEIISVEPMTFDLSRQLLQRRVPGFNDSFVWLSLALSGGVPRRHPSGKTACRDDN